MLERQGKEKVQGAVAHSRAQHTILFYTMQNNANE